MPELQTSGAEVREREATVRDRGLQMPMFPAPVDDCDCPLGECWTEPGSALVTCPCRRRMFPKINELALKCTAGHVVTLDELYGRGVDPHRDPVKWRRLCRALRRSWRLSTAELQE